jgi:transaldolase
MGHGAVGATSNPPIVLGVLKKELHLWRDRIDQLVKDYPTWSAVEVSGKLFEELTLKGAEQLRPVFEREGGKKGRLSIQTDPERYRDSEALVSQALHFHELAPNMQVKIPVTKAGIRAIEEATRLGVNINATVSFSVPQAIAVAEAVARGLQRREEQGLETEGMTPVCTIMVGRLDDWLHVLTQRDGIIANPSYLDWAGVACMKRAYVIYQERGYRTRLLAAAYRHHLHWSELIGGDLILTIPYAWQKRFNASSVVVRERIHEPVAEEIVNELCDRFYDFRRAYNVDGLTVDDFDTFGPTVRTLRSFIAAKYEMIEFVRGTMLPDPDVKA